MSSDKKQSAGNGHSAGDVKRKLLEKYLSRRTPSATREDEAIPRRPAGEPVPLSFAQQQVWLHMNLEGDSGLYNEPMTIHRHGSWDPAVLQRSLVELVRRHEIFRTTFLSQGDQVFQVVGDPPLTFELPHHDLRSLPASVRQAEALRLAAEDAGRQFDLQRGPLLRALLVRLGDEEYRLYLTFHQLVFDGATAYRLVLPELKALYEAFSQNQPSPLPEPALQYGDFAAWQAHQQPSREWEEQLDWWKRQLAGDLPTLGWPGNSKRAAQTSHTGLVEHFRFPEPLVRRLKALGSQENNSLYATMLAGLAALLHRYTSLDEVVVGSLWAGRRHPELEAMAGDFVNPLALRLHVGGDPSFRDLLARARATLLDAISHDAVPFHDIVKSLEPRSDARRNSLFQVILSLQPQMPSGHSGWNLSTEDVGNGRSKLDLMIVMDNRDDELFGPVTFNPALLDAPAVRRLLGHWRELLAGAVENPDQRLSELPLLTPAERSQIEVEWQGATAPYPESTIPALFLQQAERTPDRVALRCGSASWTYRELRSRADQVACMLADLGIQPEASVGICVERSPEMVAGLLGIMQAGAAYVPLDPAYPAERIAFIARDSGARVLLSHKPLAGRLPQFQGDVLWLDELPSEPRASRQSPLPPAGPDALAYILYTSGSTGVPKGVLGTHRGAINRMSWMWREFPFADGEICCQKTSLNFVDSVWEVFGPLLRGVPLVIVPDHDLKDPRRLGALFVEQGITRIVLVPSFLRALLESGSDIASQAAGVRLWITSGESLPVEVAERFRAALPDSRLLNLYGCTEAAADSTCCIASGSPHEERVPIGRPIANTQIHLLDPQMRRVPVGVTGELYIAGSGVARGYWNRPEINAERFVPDPFAGREGARMYRTGDLARYLPDGAIEYLGRRDHQVKVRGFRIELGEVEAALSRLGLGQCAVVLRETAPGEPNLVAYCERRPGAELTAADLRNHLAGMLPEFMIPSLFVLTERLPLTPNGKIDRKSLPAPAHAGSAASTEFAAPQSETQRALAAVFGEVLRVARVGIHDDFFLLGGHSLLAIRAVSRIREALGVEVPLRTLFAEPTVARLARAIEEGKGTSAVPRIEKSSEAGPRPLSFSQERLWFLNQLAPESPVYNIVDVVRFDGPAAPIRPAVDELVRRHETLRTSFAVREGHPVQVVNDEARLTLSELDLSALGEADRAREWKRLVRDEGRRPFNLAASPLVRASLVHFGPRDHRLLLVIHHIISDEWSMEIVHRELHELYAAFAEGRPSALPDLPIQYGDFAAWHRARMCGEFLDSRLAYWKSELAGAPQMLDLPADKPRPAGQSFRGATESLSLPKELLAGLTALGHREHTTLFMTLAAAFLALLHRHTGQDDLLIGTPISGRTRHETEGLIGCFINTVVLRAQISPGLSFRELLQQMRHRALGAYSHQELPFEQLVSQLAPQRDLSRSPLIQVLFVLLDAQSASGTSNVSALSELHTGTSKFDLSLAMAESADGLLGLFEYSTDLYHPEAIRRFAAHFRVLLESVVRDPDQSVAAIDILPAAERRELLLDWNATRTATGWESLCLHQVFSEQARRTPAAIAAEFDGRKLTYAELDRRSSLLARHLRRAGLGPDSRAGLLVERSLDMLVGLLGILKAGGAYVPLDPSFPKDRLAFMIKDSGMSVLVTHRGLDALLPVRPHVTFQLDSDLQTIDSSADEPLPDSTVQPRNLAYVLYTSGSSGTPKGVAVPHSAIVNFLASMRFEPGFAPADTLLAVTTISFDIAGLELYLPLVTGGRVVLAGREDSQDPLRLAARIQQSGCTVMQATPATWSALVESGWSGSPALKVLCGGEALSRDLAEQLLPRCAELWNLYGPTETTVWSTLHRVTRADRTVPIGRPIANTRVYVLDSAGHPVPVGASGELHIGGHGLARGYLNRADLTSERFLPSPFLPEDRLYRTGDLARWLPDGSLEWLSRADFQVKIRGFRIELGEIESVLASHKAVRRCLVAARKNGKPEALLVAYFEPEQGGVPAPADLRAHLAQHLPDYMIPSVFMPLDSFPLTPNGKVDRKALPNVGLQPHESSREFVAPRDSLEQMLVQLWARILEVPRVGVHDNFFEMGGHSLLAVRLMAEIERRLKVRLPLALLLQSPTVAALAQCLRDGNWKPSWQSLVPVRPGGSKPPLFLMHAHGGNVLEYYPLATHLDPDQPVYALQSRGLDGHIVKGQSVEEMAAEYVREIRNLQPSGPYFLGGFCFGGLLALDAARQLRAAGEDVALLVVIQTIHPAAARFRPEVSRFRRLWLRVLRRMGLEREKLSHRGAHYFRERAERVWEVASALPAIWFEDLTGRSERSAKKPAMSYVLAAITIENDKASSRYTPRPYAGNVLLLRARHHLPGLVAGDSLGWEDIFRGNLKICEVPGYQENILLEPHVARLAGVISAHLHSELRAAGAPAQDGSRNSAPWFGSPCGLPGEADARGICTHR